MSGTVLLVGEIHGTQESPAFVGDVICQALARDLEVVVGLELHPREQASLDTFLASDGGSEAEGRLLASQHWSQSYQDGRASVAILDLVRELRQHVDSGRPLRVVLFDEQVANRDVAMATRLSAAVQGASTAFVVALTGNLHARLALGSPWNESFEPMGMHLRERLPGRTVRSIDVAHSGGHAWICTSGDAEGCGPHSLGGSDDSQSPGVHLSPDASGADGHFSGRYVVGSIHASPPAGRQP